MSGQENKKYAQDCNMMPFLEWLLPHDLMFQPVIRNRRDAKAHAIGGVVCAFSHFCINLYGCKRWCPIKGCQPEV